MKPIKLSILICSLHARARTLADLLDQLSNQPGCDQVEILVSIDNGQAMRGPKRNELIARAQGDYTVFIDDDDMVADDYVRCVLAAMETKPDAIAIRGVREDQTGHNAKIVFDYKKMGVESSETDSDGVLWHNPGHLCPIRREITQAVLFPEAEPEDIEWLRRVGPHIETVARASDKPLYFYLWDSKKIDRYHRVSARRDTALELRDTPLQTPIKAPTVAPTTDHRALFTPQYTERSGPGSTAAFSEPYRWFIERFLVEHKIKSVTDLGCGDGIVASHIDWHDANYLGLDVINERVLWNRDRYPHLQFACADIRYEQPTSDLVLVKDVIQHWSNDEVLWWLSRMQRGSFKYLLVTNCCYGNTNIDCPTGQWRALDLTKPPFSIGVRVFSWGIPNKDVVLIEGR